MTGLSSLSHLFVTAPVETVAVLADCLTEFSSELSIVTANSMESKPTTDKRL